MTTEDKQKDVTAAEQRLQAGIDAYNDGELDVAAQAFGDAEIHFRLLGNFKRAGDSRSLLADIQRLERRFQEATANYQYVLEIYESTRDAFGIVDGLLGLGHIYLAQWQLERAADTFAEAMKKARSIEYELGEADGSLGLAEVALLNDRVDQALASAQAANQTYSDMHNALGAANANRLLGEINLRRGQLAYANATIERALRTYKAVAYRIGQAEAAAVLGEIQRRRGFLEPALQTLDDARKLSRAMQDDVVESRAFLSIGDIYRQQGRTVQAETCYRDAQARAERLGASGEVEGGLGVAEAAVRLARLAGVGGRLGEAASLLNAADKAVTANSFGRRVTPM